MTTLLQASTSTASLASTCGQVSSSSSHVSRVSRISYSGLRAVPSIRHVSSSATRISSVKSTGVRCEAKEKVEATAGEVTDSTFKKLVLESKVPVLVDFWAPWCGPCRMIAPLIDELSVSYGNKLTCLKLNTDDSPGVATEYGIRSIPTVMIFKNGKKMDTVIGAVPKTTLTSTIEKYLD